MDSQTPSETEQDTNTVEQSILQHCVNSSAQSAFSGFSQFSHLSTNEIGYTSNPGTSSGANGSSTGRDSNLTGASATNPESLIPSASMHLCCVCGDGSTRKLYGAYCCGGCRAFFKRTVRANVSLSCLKEQNCVIDKVSRNNCQYCRYQKCVAMGMKPQYVQMGRRSAREQASFETMKTPLKQLMEEKRPVQNLERVMVGTETLEAHEINLAAYKELFQLIKWAKQISYFNELPLHDRVVLLRSGWNDLLILDIAYRSMNMEDTLILANGLAVCGLSANQVGLAEIFNHVLFGVVTNLKQMKWGEEELACFKLIVLFDLESPDLSPESMQPVKRIRDNVQEILKRHTHAKYPTDSHRYTILESTPALLRWVSMNSREHLFFNRVIPDTLIDDYLMDNLADATSTDK